ncbi:MAG: insulinase family protein [Actinomycetota bacterium]|nr:insulinase family protein [Actinomycetota bacterium]
MERLEHGGVPLFWEQGPEPAIGALLFRAGEADEPPARRGQSHMVEHLALHRVGRREFSTNGFVDLLQTGFYASGTAVEVSRFLHEVTLALGEPTQERFDRELDVLRTEAARDTGDFVSRILHLRYGSRGFGVAHLQELGLRWMRPPDVEEWRAERFTAGNAVAWMLSPRPPELDLRLPAGERHPPPSAEALPGLRFPAWIDSGTGRVAGAMVAGCSWELSAALNVAHERLYERLREARGISYSVDGGAQPLGADTSHISIGADCLDERGAEVAREMLEILGELAELGPTEEELDALRRRADRPDPDERGTRLGRLADAADDLLLGRETPSPGEAEARRAAVTAPAAGDALAAALDSMIVIVPEGCDAPRAGLHPLEREAEPIAAPRVRARAWRQADELLIGEAGVQWEDGEGSRITIPADEIAFVVRTRDGDMTVHGIDGSYVTVNPARIVEPETAMAALDELARGRLIEDDDPATPLIDSVAEEQLKRRWTVADELDLLLEVLHDGEQPRLMAEATRGIRTGLLVQTDRRLLFLFKGMRNEEFLDVALGDVAGVESSSRPWGSRLRVTGRGERLEFSSIVPRERAAEIAGALRAGGR